MLSQSLSVPVAEVLDEVCMHMKRISTTAHLYSAPQDVGFRVGYRTGAKRPSPGPMGMVYAGCCI
jgi:hypothetical protein